MFRPSVLKHASPSHSRTCPAPQFQDYEDCEDYEDYWDCEDCEDYEDYEDCEDYEGC